ncbi:MAG: hypothetical protein L7H18_00845 [Candidatus Nealsonbacteria bacterium DGGOD1a]|nr:MAG: hypothetical protein L7H18_00845 [Candidatus Nealsonbacteria bacterium DGGOD1a]
MIISNLEVISVAFEVKEGESFADALKREVRNGVFVEICDVQRMWAQQKNIARRYLCPLPRKTRTQKEKTINLLILIFNDERLSVLK